MKNEWHRHYNLFSTCNCLNENDGNKDHFLKHIYLDPFKADIYSAGLTIYEAATGNSVRGMNNRSFDQTKCFNEINKLELPR